MHVLEAGFEAPGRPCLLLLHGFPELAYSWRKVMLPLAAAGYHVVAPDQRGYGRTTGWTADYDGDLGPFRLLNLVRDVAGLVSALGYRSVAGVVGHDFGSPVAAWCALVRPDVFRSVALMSAPFAGPPSLPFDTDASAAATSAQPGPSIHDALAALSPPRKHYHWYYSTRPANARCRDARRAFTPSCAPTTTTRAPTGRPNRPYPLAGMDGGRAGKNADVLRDGPSHDHGHDGRNGDAVACRSRRVQVAARKGVCRLRRGVRAQRLPGRVASGTITDGGRFEVELEVFAGRTVDVPSIFIAGRSDWGVYQTPGVVERMQESRLYSDARVPSG